MSALMFAPQHQTPGNPFVAFRDPDTTKCYDDGSLFSRQLAPGRSPRGALGGYILGQSEVRRLVKI
jgi:hypothetical protein